MTTGFAQSGGGSDPNATGSGAPGATSGAPSAQTAPGTDMSRNGNRDDNNHDFNMGWLGLVGLAGLLGMRRHNQRHDDVRNIDNTGPSSMR